MSIPKKEDSQFAGQEMQELWDANQLLLGSHSATRLVSMMRHQVPIGYGNEKIVYDYTPSKVAQFIRHKAAADRLPYNLKTEFFIRKLAKILIPEFLPDVYLVASSPLCIIAEKIEGEQFQDESDYINKACDRFIGIGASLDSSPENFILNRNGNAVYVDSLAEGKWKLNTLESSIAELPPIQGRQANKFLSRLVESDWPNLY